MIFNILITLFFVLLNAFFVAAEFAIVKVRSTQIDILAQKGTFTAKVAQHLITHLNEYLSACQLGITIASLGLGWIGEPVVSKIILWIFDIVGIHITIDVAEKIALPAAFVTITILHIVFGELAPKSLAIIKAEKTALFVSIPLRIFYFIFKPFIWTLNEMANQALKLLGISAASDFEIHSEEEIREILKSSYKEGAIEETKEKLLQNVFDFSQITAKQVMVPRNRIVGIERRMRFKDVYNKFISEGYSRMPVYDTNIDNIIGIIYAKDLLQMLAKNDTTNFEIDRILRKPLFVNENQKIQDILKLMQKEKVHLAVVIDDFGGTAGLITIEDILEELVGEIQDEFDEEPPKIKRLSENEYEILGETPIDEINKTLNIKIPKSKVYETIGGFVTYNSRRIPQKGEKFNFEGFSIEVISISERKVGKVKLILID
jgi:CBS domain containing-hemolysin-like protein